MTFESTLQPNIHVIGDAAIAGGMPKSAFAANAQAKVCAEAVAMLLAGEAPTAPEADQHLLQPGRARTTGSRSRASIAPAKGVLADVEGAGGVSPLDAPARVRARRGPLCGGWFETITAEVFG